jgi:hypothetical protein
MVDFQDQVRLPSFKTRLAWSPPEDETHRKGKQARAKPLERNRGALTVSGLDLETKIFSASGRGGGFFLTSLFIELIDPAEGVLSAIAWSRYSEGENTQPFL